MRYEYFARNAAEEYLRKGIADGSSFPDMELYIDQLVSSLNKELEIYKTGEEGPVTKAMVSNYTKHKMLPGPDGKKYTKDHLYFMLMVFYLKNCLSMDQIRRLMAPILANYSSEWDDKADIEGLFKSFNDFLRTQEEGLPSDVSTLIAEIKHRCSKLGSEDDTAELIVLIMSLVMRSNAERYLAEKLLEEYFAK